jgi:LmeA-like phospholipid-binding
VTVYEAEEQPRRRRGRRVLGGFIVLLIIIVALLAVADRAGASYAENILSDRVAQQVANQKATSDKPDVTIEGIPFLTQVATGRYQEIKIELRDFAGPAANGKTIKMPLLDIRAKDVDAPLSALRSGQGNVVAKTVTGTGTVDYATLAQLSGQQGVKLGEKDGKLTVTAPLTILNQQVTVNGTADLTVRGNVVSMHFDKVTAAGLPQLPLVANLLTNFAKQISVDLRIPPLPLKLTVRSVQPTAAGLVVTARADNVEFNSAGV